MTLSAVERDILRKLSVKQLQFMIKVSSLPNFVILEEVGEVLADYERRAIFKFPEAVPQALAIEKAHSRGKATGYKQMGRLILAASGELERREKDLEEKKRGDK